jgi:hypothetical protein
MIKLFEQFNEERVICLRKLYDYLVSNGISDINFIESIPLINNIPTYFSVSLSNDIYKDIIISSLSDEKYAVVTKIFKYHNFDVVVDFLKDLELKHSVKKYNI